MIVFRDAEDLARRFLLSKLVGVPELSGTQCFVGSLPKTLPALSVFIRRTGGPARDRVTDLAQLTFECRAKAGSKAERLVATVGGFLRWAEDAGMMLEAPVYEVNALSNGYLDPDPVNPSFERYTATFQVAIRGEQI